MTPAERLLAMRGSRDVFELAPPHDLDAERAVLACVLLEPARLPDVRRELPLVDCFYDAAHRAIYCAMRKVADRGATIDVTLLAAELQNSGTAQAVAELWALVEHVPHASNVDEYAQRVGDCAARRAAREAGVRLLQSAYTGDPIGTAIGATAEALRCIVERCNGDDAAPVLVALADVEPRAVSWLWPGRIPLGRITLLVGRPGEGKSFVTIEAAARVSTGTPWPDGSDCPQGSVILISAEDDPADTIRPRLDAHYADVRRVHLLSAVRRVDGDGHYERMITLADVDAIEAALMRLPDCKLIVVDPVGSFLGGGTDAHRDNAVRGVLAPIARLAEKHGAAVLVVAHRRKSTGTNADDLALGSRAFTGIARAVWHLTRDSENKARRLLLPGKNNLAHEGDGLAFSIIGEPARISWERDPVAMSADDALASESQSREQKPGPDAEALDAASGWLLSALGGGPRPAKDLIDEWKNGQGGSERTLNRAKQSLGVDAYRLEIPGPWWWRLPGKDAKPSQDGKPGPLGTLAENAGILTGSDPDDSKGAKMPEPGILGGERVRVTI